ncbi:hypothetical protein Tco_1230458, partial [Tanacetum coccineum]
MAMIKDLRDNEKWMDMIDFKNSSGSTTTRSDYSLLDYEAFYFDDDHIEEKSSGSTTTRSDISLSKYDSFIFDLSNDPFPTADRSDFYHEEFADELAHIISPPEYDCFYFKSEPGLGNCNSYSNRNTGGSVTTRSQGFNKNNNATVKPNPFKRLTDAEFADKKAKGICFRCDEKFGPGHRCPGKTLQVLLVGDEDETEDEFDGKSDEH